MRAVFARRPGLSHRHRHLKWRHPLGQASPLTQPVLAPLCHIPVDTPTLIIIGSLQQITSGHSIRNPQRV